MHHCAWKSHQREWAQELWSDTQNILSSNKVHHTHLIGYGLTGLYLPNILFLLSCMFIIYNASLLSLSETRLKPFIIIGTCVGLLCTGQHVVLRLLWPGLPHGVLWSSPHTDAKRYHPLPLHCLFTAPREFNLYPFDLWQSTQSSYVTSLYHHYSPTKGFLELLPTALTQKSILVSALQSVLSNPPQYVSLCNCSFSPRHVDLSNLPTQEKGKEALTWKGSTNQTALQRTAGTA